MIQWTKLSMISIADQFIFSRILVTAANHYEIFYWISTSLLRQNYPYISTERKLNIFYLN